jgi:hypothetical protein
VRRNTPKGHPDRCHLPSPLPRAGEAEVIGGRQMKGRVARWDPRHARRRAPASPNRRPRWIGRDRADPPTTPDGYRPRSTTMQRLRLRRFGSTYLLAGASAAMDILIFCERGLGDRNGQEKSERSAGQEQHHESHCDGRDALWDWRNHDDCGGDPRHAIIAAHFIIAAVLSRPRPRILYSDPLNHSSGTHQTRTILPVPYPPRPRAALPRTPLTVVKRIEDLRQFITELVEPQRGGTIGLADRPHVHQQRTSAVSRHRMSHQTLKSPASSSMTQRK